MLFYLGFLPEMPFQKFEHLHLLSLKPVLCWMTSMVAYAMTLIILPETQIYNFFSSIVLLTPVTGSPSDQLKEVTNSKAHTMEDFKWCRHSET